MQPFASDLFHLVLLLGQALCNGAGTGNVLRHIFLFASETLIAGRQQGKPGTGELVTLAGRCLKRLDKCCQEWFGERGSDFGTGQV